ncbi:MAG: hypothetical protein IH985_04330 [Planctomycetes bacterium]|nr:hypothetical protein [Planctomycetota bacterium]
MTEPSSIRGTIRLPAARMGWRGCAAGIAVVVVMTAAIGSLTGVGVNELIRAGMLAGLCVLAGVGLGLAIESIGGAMVMLASTVCGMATAVALGLVVQVALDPSAGPFWLAIAGGSTAAMWARIATVLPVLGHGAERDV